MVKSSKKPGAASCRQRKMGVVMGEYKRGKLKSGSGARVKSRRQAIAIGMAESRRKC